MPDQVVVCGGGIMGVATAYYLTLQGVKPTLVEKRGIACAASGTARTVNCVRCSQHKGIA